MSASTAASLFLESGVVLGIMPCMSNCEAMPQAVSRAAQPSRLISPGVKSD